MTVPINRTLAFLVVAAFARLFAQPRVVPESMAAAQQITASTPMPVTAPAAGTWNYKVTIAMPNRTIAGNYSVTVKEDGGAWTVTGHWPTSEMMPIEATDVTTLERGTLLLRKESFRRFPKPGQTQNPLTVDLDLTGNQLAGVSTGASGETKPLSTQLSAPVFAGGVAIDVVL